MKTCKKLGKILLCAGMLTAAAAVPAFAADANVSLAVEGQTVADKDTVNAQVNKPITVTVNTVDKELAGLGFYLTFDTEYLELSEENIVFGENVKSYLNSEDENIISLTEANEGIYSFGIASTENLTYSSEDSVLTLTFTPKKATTEKSTTVTLVENSSQLNGNAFVETNKGTVATVDVNIAEASSDKFTVGGTVTSFITDSNVTVELFKEGTDTAVYSTTAITKDTTTTVAKTTVTSAYSIENVASGSYTMKVSKANHVTREYEVSVVDGVVAQDVKICPIGDATNDGVIKINDVNMVYQHFRRISTLSGYPLECGDAIASNGTIKINDVNAINSHFRGISSLWQ